MTCSSGWKELSLAEVCSLRGGAAFKPALQGQRTGPFPFIKVSDFNSSENLIRIAAAKNWVNEADTEHIKGKPFAAGTSVFAKIGEALKQNRVRMLTQLTFLDNNLMGALPKPGVVEPEFLFHVLRTFNFAATNAGTAVPYLTAGTLGRQKVCIPAVSVQRRIASILGAYDDLIQVNRRRIAILEEMTRGLFDEWFVRFRFPSHENSPMVETPDGSLPKGWRWAKLGQLCDDVRDGVAPADVAATTAYVGLEHIPRRSITLDAWGEAEEVTSTKLRFRRGDVLFGKIRPYFHKVTVAPCDGVASSDAIVIRAKTDAVRGLVLCVTSSDSFVAHSVQTSNGTKMPRANWSVLARYPVPLPPGDLLDRFNRTVIDAADLAMSYQAANRRLAASRDLLLPRLVSGELSVAVAERKLEAAA